MLAVLFLVGQLLCLASASKAKTYCYQSLKTLDDDTDENANCFDVSTDGQIARVYRGPAKLTGHAYPGLWDGHGHLLQYGELLKSVDLFGSKSLDEAMGRVLSYAADHPDAGTTSQWIRGVGWDQAAFGRMPTAVRDSNATTFTC